MKELQQAKAALQAGEYTCVLCVGEEKYTTSQRGVKPLVQWLKQGSVPIGFSAADKVVGKATAFLYCLLGAKAVYANVMSQSAREVFQAHGIVAQWGALVDYIENRTKDGVCPFEAAVLKIDDPEQALFAVYDKMKELGIE